MGRIEMKAIVQRKAGPPEILRLVDVDRPAPGDDEHLVKVHASSVTQGDVMLRKLHPLLYLPMRLFGVKRKRIPGHEYAGEIVAAGRRTSRFGIGDRVFGTTTGLPVGAHAEYVCVPESAKTSVMAGIPANISFEEAAVVPVGGMTALTILDRAEIAPGSRVLIYGASGSVGSYAVQVARHRGAAVTGVCSTRNLALVESLGAENVIDYTVDDFSKSGCTYDIIFDAVGKLSAADCRGALADGGSFLTVQTTTKETAADLERLAALLGRGALRPVIDRSFPLERIADAHRLVESGRKRGNVAITV